MSKLAKLPEVLATQRGYVVTDGQFFNVLPSDRRTPVEVINHTVIGVDNKKLDTNGFNSLANPQRIDSAKLDPNALAYEVVFQLSFLPIDSVLSKVAGTNSQELKASLKKFLQESNRSEGLAEIAHRYARNIFNGRWLWRNRMTAKSVKISVSVGEQNLGASNALAIPLNDFDVYVAEEKALAAIIFQQLQGINEDEIKVTALLTPRVQGSIEVFPSQNYIDKQKGAKGVKSKSLYVLNRRPLQENHGEMFVVGDAALRDQKIANAIRTIDTWYSDDPHIRPIAIEQFGANLDDQCFYRKGGKSSGIDAYSLMKQCGELDPNTPEGMYFIGCLVRGGVYALSKKD
ncbi:type I-F CRISPR-associated protein Csy3 [Photobacterium lutimaris]|uniref:Type I-F CRISPR-associated protein Csy3 n=1 Tax=Photobacterium lutimaris TaxID=388278 RepID=A0A2T3J4S4_9GAMM|nr:type I-F CRISPR-associated protein Csy3 [Photobacterium lutimaris]PSU36279.1 type I-F CRISPR-associated protein Csy3 [Photobacterium lutimaris]TDR74838.1 CRISPR-associated Csy3 family protein [Photobacterium lutimaris]